MMNSNAFIRASLVAGSLAAFMAAAYAAAPPQGIPQPKILVIDRQAIFAGSAAGRSVLQQARTYDQQLQSDYNSKISALRSEGQKLQQQTAILSNEVRAQKLRDLESRGKSIEQNAQQKLNTIKGGVLQAQEQIGNALKPILQGIMMERGANMLLDRNAVIFSTVDVDVTQVAIQRLNQKLSTVKFTPTPIPAGVQAQ
jgi:Skp family chaperone for outer membrane proteins